MINLAKLVAMATFKQQNQRETAQQETALKPRECVQVWVWQNWRKEYAPVNAVVGTVTPSGEIIVYPYHGTTEPQYPQYGQQPRHHFGAAMRVSKCDVAHRYGTEWVD